jgi:hypothetical protein
MKTKTFACPFCGGKFQLVAEQVRHSVPPCEMFTFLFRVREHKQKKASS